MYGLPRRCILIGGNAFLKLSLKLGVAVAIVSKLKKTH
jgi:hypothetical protein